MSRVEDRELPPLASFWQRLLATIVDGVLVTVLSLVVASVAGIAAGTQLTSEVGGGVFIATLFFVGCTYWTLGTAGGATLGKRAFNLRIVPAEGRGELTLAKGFARWILASIFLLLTVSLGHLWMLVDRRGQTLHDKVIGTLVVRFSVGGSSRPVTRETVEPEVTLPSGIDASVVLGLAGKISTVFADPGQTYLSFPLNLHGMASSRFEGINRVETPEDAAGLAEFSAIMSELPNGPLWQPSGEKRLWSVYGDVLSKTQLAKSTLTAAEKDRYQEVDELLNDRSPDGTRVPSAMALAYAQYADAYWAAVREYNNRKGQAEISDDQDIQDAWEQDKPTLHATMQDAMDSWRADGHREEVDRARREFNDFASRSPANAWAEYRKHFDPNLPDIFFQTGPNGSLYLPAGYLPSDVVNLTWNTITLNREDLKKYTEEAPQELRSRLETGSVDSNIDFVSFEYSSVSITRPWFMPEVFESRAWRFYENERTRVLSDGKTPPTGECTAYISDLLLARNITIGRAGPASNANLLFLPNSAKTVDIALHTRPVLAETLEAEAAERRILGGGRLNRPASLATPRGRIHVQPTVEAKRLPARAEPPPRPRSAASTTTEPDQLIFLAFICRLLPRSPNPDSYADW